jgi:hypothetical protein
MQSFLSAAISKGARRFPIRPRIGVVLRRLLLPGALCFALGTCVSDGIAETRALVRSTPAFQFERYDFDPARPLHSRVGPVPEHVLAYVRKLDERPDYRSYSPTAAEMRLIKRSLERLPPRLKRNLERRGLGIYFIDDFLTSGLTDWAIAANARDERRPEIFSYMVFHAKTLKTSMRDLLNRRESTCFGVDQSGVKIEIRIDGDESAFMYLLMHEAVHALDYSERISPYLEPAVRPYQNRLPRDVGAGALIDRVWAEYREPRAGYDFPGRDQVTFYGFGGGPRLLLGAAPEIYAGLSRSPFVSLYGSQIWPEDLAELVSMYYLTEALGRAYSIRLTRDGAKVADYEPLKSPAVRERLGNLRDYFK